MFTRIAPRYDLMNRLITAGQDVRWRREVIRLAALPSQGKILDLGAGTGDLALESIRQHPDCLSIAADFTIEMMRVGLKRTENEGLNWSAADALELPFDDETFNAVVSGFLLRNVVDIHKALVEQIRVLKPGGMMVALDTTRPRPNLLSPLIRFHMKKVIPTLGKLITRDGPAYTYLPETSQNFLLAEQLAANMVAVGYRDVGFRRLMFGTVAIHWGIK
jgi:demethylmenaquinone methyltransferase/2-methoxy-6-polyprenyl-1,4-benzoquinol methylase